MKPKRSATANGQISFVSVLCAANGEQDHFIASEIEHENGESSDHVILLYGAIGAVLIVNAKAEITLKQRQRRGDLFGFWSQ